MEEETNVKSNYSNLLSREPPNNKENIRTGINYNPKIINDLNKANSPQNINIHIVNNNYTKYTIKPTDNVRSSMEKNENTNETNTFRKSSNNPHEKYIQLNKHKKVDLNPSVSNYEIKNPIRMMPTEIPKYSALKDNTNLRPSTSNSSNKLAKDRMYSPYSPKENKSTKDAISIRLEGNDRYSLNNVSSYSTNYKPRVSTTRPSSSDRYAISNKSTPKKFPKQPSYLKDSSSSQFEIPKRSSSVTNKKLELGRESNNIYLSRDESSKYTKNLTKNPSQSIIKDTFVEKTNRSYSTKNNRLSGNFTRTNQGQSTLSENKRIYTSNINSNRSTADQNRTGYNALINNFNERRYFLNK